MSYNLSPAPRLQFFDNDGNDISREEFRALRKAEEDADWGVQMPRISQRLIARHPRVLLAFFRFIESLNEVAFEDEKVKIPQMSSDCFLSIMEYIEKNGVPDVFNQEVADLQYYLSMNLAGL